MLTYAGIIPSDTAPILAADPSTGQMILQSVAQEIASINLHTAILLYTDKRKHELTFEISGEPALELGPPTAKTIPNDLRLSYNLQEVRPESYTIGLVNDAALPQGALLAAQIITEQDPDLQLIPIAMHAKKADQVDALGSLLYKKINAHNERVGLFACIDTTDPEADIALLGYLQDHDTTNALQDQRIIDALTALQPALALLAMLRDTAYTVDQITINHAKGLVSSMVALRF
jgi:hypothetical protein